ncbi:cupin domain-containing protein [Hyphomicrobium sp.]|uniref:cupin domain-containing protein n=1 Tax=Hyphomicrobium sp. TaxID=82 RepID=UPI003F6FCDC2
MTRFVRLAWDGAGDLEDWGAMPGDELVAGTGQQHGRLWLDDADTGLMVGVWHCTPMTGRMDAWSTNEVMVLLDGAVTIDHADGSSITVSKGEAFFIPKGTLCSWRQEVDLKKFFVIHSDSSGLSAADPTALKARKIDFGAALTPSEGPPASLLVGPAPVCHESVAFTDLTGQLWAGIWSATPYTRQPVVSARHELMHVVDGEMTLSDGHGRAETFVAGDTCFVPNGATAGWSSTVPVRKLFASFTPKA